MSYMRGITKDLKKTFLGPIVKRAWVVDDSHNKYRSFEDGSEIDLDAHYSYLIETNGGDWISLSVSEWGYFAVADRQEFLEDQKKYIDYRRERKKKERM